MSFALQLSIHLPEEHRFHTSSDNASHHSLDLLI